MRKEHFGISCETCQKFVGICEASRMEENLDFNLLSVEEQLAVQDFYEAHVGHDVQPVLFEIEAVGKA